MTIYRQSDTASRMGRKKEIETKVLATFHEGTLDRIAAVLDEGENRTEFIRVAVEGEIKRRERAKRQRSQHD